MPLTFTLSAAMPMQRYNDPPLTNLSQADALIQRMNEGFAAHEPTTLDRLEGRWHGRRSDDGPDLRGEPSR